MKRFKLKRRVTLAVLAGTTVLAAGEAVAQSLFGNSSYGYGYGGRDLTLYLMMVRIATMGTSAALGFGIGWFLSPKARQFRKVAALVALAVGGAIAVFNNGSLGWSMTTLLSAIGFFAALGYWLGTAVKALGEVPSTFGSAKWADAEELAERGLFNKDGLRLGTFFNGEEDEAIAYKGDRHLLTVAPTRSGKGTTQIIVNLLSYPGSALVIDPKGENAKITARARRDMGQDVKIVDPWNIVNDPEFEIARFNPLDWLEAGDVDITENAMLLADALIMQGSHGDRFWAEEAKGLLQGVILYVATDEREAGQRHLPRVRDLLLLDGDNLKMLFERMLESPHHVVASTGARFLQRDEKLLSNVMASAQAETHFLDSARLRESLSASDFRFEDLKTEKMSVYLVAPVDRLHAFGRWFRLMVQQAITVNARNIEVQPDKPILFLLDELAAFGRLTMIEQAYGLMAGFGMQLWGIIQDVGQLKTNYGEGWETFIGNSGVLQYFGSVDRTTAEYFSALCGVTTVWNFSSAVSNAVGTSSGSGGLSSSESTTSSDTRAAAQRKLAYPDELMRMHDSKQLLFIGKANPIIARRVPWFEDPELKAKGVDIRAKAATTSLSTPWKPTVMQQFETEDLPWNTTFATDFSAPK
ncbi:type IV secretory system conjugative DNA transfer family protein [Rhodovulum sulfidophilum]|uniref:type IV secretory system conjugative DNA transfer family protein n=1 Tax=Rhodovulum sulfidophilum TaxID=35806 RepID=UPI001924EF1C|nr:type IV secretory system conjugative DNA transfer family protein [Rhodovulum sulfidophilum]MBL3575654.1 type IV secretory system conjugative DNA transfer family protein [Rhodovulum sulfidophilum]MCE8431414.1 type IV secretory system conjugative DNA transfer family protein [Rhodovulum sulfidophilum]MCF4118595.1 type IV secretory system conjugative DNA transfer family protein [Rhodovulum sulfidophilum]